ncbi:MAG: EAL domain-containing protein [Cellvibrionaceae bacterium]|nr:EAL domain-containing protein [Cellvibrionaceae bacterium]MCV6627840.1 EAL domain-containing protein [Cellvibrionaceae bacterium]
MESDKTSYLGLVELVDYEYLMDIHGVDLAEQIYAEFIKRLQQWIRDCDQSKILKDKRFLVVLNRLDSGGSLELATAKLQRLFDAPYILLGQPTFLEINAGFTKINGTELDTAGRVRQARIALKHAKQDRVFYKLYSNNSSTGYEQQKQLIKTLYRALDHGEFQLYYQPKIHAGYGTVVGAEALIRWHTADNRVVPPNAFINVIERHEIARPLTWWIIKTAVARLAKWPKSINVSVNVPPLLLQDQEIVDVIIDALDIHGVAASRLTIEVTESVMMDHLEQAVEQLNKLRALGIKISIDDFGTGHSSLEYLKKLPIDELKIDRVFIKSLCQSNNDQVVVKSVVEMAHSFKLKVVAEGVEDQATAALLKHLGCDHLQGFLFDKPIPAKDFEKRHIV